MSDEGLELVRSTLLHAIALYEADKMAFPFRQVAINPRHARSDTALLTVYIVADANERGVDESGCLKSSFREEDPLDELSVAGACLVRGGNLLEMRCSARALHIFGERGNRIDRENPSLLYLLGHELAHIYQRQAGEYSGRTQRLRLAAKLDDKIAALKQYCAPSLKFREREADAHALRILKRAVAAAPYRERVLSERGSLLWNVDLLSMTADRWLLASSTREVGRRSSIHPAFVPKEFPMPPERVKTNAQQFVCDVLRKRSGEAVFPSPAGSHPSASERLKKIAESIRQTASDASDSIDASEFPPIARLQQDLSAALVHMYVERGVYLESVEDGICTLVNSSDPLATCAAERR